LLLLLFMPLLVDADDAHVVDVAMVLIVVNIHVVVSCWYFYDALVIVSALVVDSHCTIDIASFSCQCCRCRPIGCILC
jgi:hypothetical protein